MEYKYDVTSSVLRCLCNRIILLCLALFLSSPEVTSVYLVHMIHCIILGLLSSDPLRSNLIIMKYNLGRKMAEA